MNTQQLLAALRAWLAEQAPGLVPSVLTVAFHNSATPLTLPIVPLASVSPTGNESVAEEPEHNQRFYRCMEDILAILETSDVPLTGLRIKSKLAHAGKEWSDRWVDEMLARMVRDGTLEDLQEGRPRGYRLPTEEER